jgi:GNAT superfamily N-acetyltransferase
MIELRQATAWDTEAIAEIKHQTWLEQNASPLQIAIALSQPGHFAVLASIDQTPVGYISCFPTVSATGQKRWEFDEIAVQPDYRRRGIAKQLISQAVIAGDRQHANQFRALIRVDNVASQQAFAAHGLSTNNTVYELYIHEQPLETDLPLPEGLYPVEVYTFSYHGHWLEGEVDAVGLQRAPQLLKTYQHDSIGVLVPETDTELVQVAAASGYEWIASYNWWEK